MEVSFKLSAFTSEPDRAIEEMPNWSIQQLASRDWVRHERGNMILDAKAGTGKSTTLVNVILPELTGFVDIVVFGKKAERDLTSKVERLQNNGVALKCRGLQVGTFHKFGRSAWKKAAPQCLVEGPDGPFGKGAGYYKFNRIVEELKIGQQVKFFVKKLLSMMKQRALGVVESISHEACIDIVRHFNLEESLYDHHGNPLPDHDKLVDQGIGVACDALRLSNDLCGEVIDMDDMLYAPLIHNVRIFQVDWLLGDEMQDSNPARRALCRRMLKPGGRAIFVGDPNQAIQGFTGADNDALDLLSEEFGCKTMPLTVSFRCPKSGVRLAQTWVPGIEAAPSAPEGSHSFINEQEFMKIPMFSDSDVILCRKNAPLVDLAYALIKKGIACHVEGRDIGTNLLALVDKWSIVRLDALSERLTKYKHREIAKLSARGMEAAADNLADRVETLQALIAGMSPHDTIKELKAKILSMFQDSEGNKAKRLTLSSIHKAKGLEWPRVYLLGRNKYQPSPYARQAWQMAQEKNLMYVGTTRHKEDLIEVKVR